MRRSLVKVVTGEFPGVLLDKEIGRLGREGKLRCELLLPALSPCFMVVNAIVVVAIILENRKQITQDQRAR